MDICFYGSFRLIENQGYLRITQAFDVPQRHCLPVSRWKRRQEGAELLRQFGKLNRPFRLLGLGSRSRISVQENEW